MRPDKDNAAKPTDSFNGNLSARPKSSHHPTNVNASEKELSGRKHEYEEMSGEMNLADARRSGYTDKEGHAVDMAKKDRRGSPTGAYTDIGAGRSSVVKPSNDDPNTSH